MPGSCFSSPADSAPAPTPAPVAPAPAKPAAPAPAPAAAPAAASAAAASTPSKMTKIAVIFYSTYGHVAQLAKKIKEGAESVEGVTVDLYQVPETLPQEVLEKIHAPPRDESIPTITADKLPEYDGFIFGTPTRFGVMAAQLKSFLDSTGGLWASGGLVGKTASIFVSVGTQGGGLETTVLTALPVLAHHGLIFVPTGYSFGERLFGVDEVRGGTAYGASTLAGATGARQPSELELDLAKHQGSYFAGVTKKVAAK